MFVTIQPATFKSHSSFSTLMDIPVSERASKVRYAVRNIARKAKELEDLGRKMLYLNIGDPGKYDFPTPKHLLDACSTALYSQQNYYAFSSGIDEARAAIAKDAAKKGIKNITAENVVITTGVSEGVDIVMNTLLNPGENILAPVPNYPLYEAIANKIGAKINPYYLDEDDGWQPDVDDMRKKIDAKTRAILFINPNNPTGAVCSRKAVQQVVDLAAEKKVPIISDEIYDQLLFDGEQHIPTASLTTEVPIITFNGLSKNHLATGWRIGWLIESNIDSRSAFATTINNLVDARLCSPTPPQFAIKAALEGPQDHVKETVRKMQERRDITFKRLNEIEGISCVKPKGTFYAFPRLTTNVYNNDERFVLDVLEKEGIVFVHGSGFGQKQGTNHFRVVFLPPPSVLNEAYDKLERFMRSLT